MINFKESIEIFKEYLKKYDLENGSIQLKIEHTYEVIKKSEYIAKNLGLNKEDIELAKLIALLHDIGRFEQIKKIQSFNDNNLDHAELGVKLLFNNNLIRKFIADNEYDTIIYKAIINHNKYKIESIIDENVLLYCKIIRDADKLDIFRVKEKKDFKYILPKIYNNKILNNEEISPKVYQDFMNHKCIKLNDMKTLVDHWLCAIAFIFDFNFDTSLQYIKENNYIEKLINRIEYTNKDTKEKIEQIKICAKNYIQTRTKD